MRTTRVSVPRVFSLFFYNNKCCFALSWEVGDFEKLVITVSKKSYRHLKLSLMRPNELWTCQDDGAARAQAPGVNVVVVGSFEEEEEGTSVASLAAT